MISKRAFIKKLPSGKYRLYSRKKDKAGKRRNLGTFDSMEAARKHERQVQFFKYHADDQNTRDKETKALSLISDTARYLEEAGYIKQANEMYAIMDAIDDKMDNEDAASDSIPDAQRNPENQGHIGGDGISGAYTGLNAMANLLKRLIETANSLDNKGFYKEASELDALITAIAKGQRFHKDITFESVDGQNPKIEVGYTKEENGKHTSERKTFTDMGKALEFFEEMEEDNNVDNLVTNIGKSNSTPIDNQQSGMFQGLSDSYFYTGYGNLEAPYKDEYR